MSANGNASIRNTNVIPANLQHPRWLVSAAAALGLLAGGPGCVLHPVDPDPAPAVDGGDSQGFSNDPNSAALGGKPGKDWWRTFRERALDKLVDDALSENPDVRAVSRRIDQANARLVQAGSTLFPQVDGAGSFQRRLPRPLLPFRR